MDMKIRESFEVCVFYKVLFFRQSVFFLHYLSLNGLNMSSIFTKSCFQWKALQQVTICSASFKRLLNLKWKVTISVWRGIYVVTARLTYEPSSRFLRISTASQYKSNFNIVGNVWIYLSSVLIFIKTDILHFELGSLQSRNKLSVKDCHEE